MIIKKTPRSEVSDDGHAKPLAAASRAPGSFWSFMKTFFVGTAGLALLAVFGTIAGNSWLTANQRAEAEKPEPWTNPSFTTTAVTTGGMLARWMDNDGNLENGHSYIKGIYDLWKVNNNKTSIMNIAADTQRFIPQLWRQELNADLEKTRVQISIQRDIETSERERLISQARRQSKEQEIDMMREYDSGKSKGNR